MVDTSIGGVRLVRELDAPVSSRGKPATIVSDSGTEMSSHAVLEWTNRAMESLLCAAPGRTSRIRSFNSLL